MFLNLPVRFTSDSEDQAVYSALTLEITKTMFFLVDYTYEDPESRIGQVLGQTTHCSDSPEVCQPTNSSLVH